MRIVFTISGKQVQNIGYRLFLLSLMKEKGVIGLASKIYTGDQVNIEAWGCRRALLDFYECVKTKKPKSAGEIIVGEKMLDSERQPAPSTLLNEKMDLMIEQTGKFVGQGIKINRTLERLPERIAVAIKGA